mgnify:CR=1 FL=1
MNLCGFEVGNDQPIFLIAGTCVVESEQMTLDTAGTLKEITSELGIPFIYKSSYDKANRSSRDGFRGPGMEEGLRILAEVKKQLEALIWQCYQIAGHEETVRVLDDLKARIDAIPSFPEEAEKPVVEWPLLRRQVVNVAVSGDIDERTLKDVAERVREWRDYGDRPRWRRLMRRAMKADFSWDVSAQRYHEAYERVLAS